MKELNFFGLNAKIVHEGFVVNPKNVKSLFSNAYSTVKRMQATKLNNFMYLVDLKPAGIEKFIAAYVLKGEKAAIIETGPTCTVKYLLAGLREIEVKPEEVEYVAVSHIHIDHAGGAGTLIQHLQNARLVVHPKGASHMADPEKLWSQTKQVLGAIADMYGEIEPVPENQIIKAEDGAIIDLGEGVELRVVETLGHASHHLSYYQEKTRAIFTGDAAGIYLNEFDVTVPTTPAPFHLEMVQASLDTLLSLKPEWLYYTHFGPANNAVDRLNAYGKQLKLWATITQKGVEKDESLESILEEIFEKDASIRRAADFIKNHPILSRGVIAQSVQGFIEYLKRHSLV